MAKEIKSGKYKHFKGKIIKVICVGKHSETLEELVIYKEIENNSIWIRPKKMFLEKVKVDGKEVPRFEFMRI